MSANHSFSNGRPTQLGTALLCVVFALAGCAGRSAARGPQRLAAAYMAIARPANHRLEVAVDSYDGLSHSNLAGAESDLREEVATESWFDQRLLKIAFPPAIGAVAAALVSANNHRIRLTKLQSRADTIAKMLALNSRHRAADAAVEAQVRIIRKDLGLPPPETS